MISHSHYDHLDLSTVILLNARYGSDVRWFIPLGLGISFWFFIFFCFFHLTLFFTADWFSRAGCENVVELDWWEENCVPDKSDGKNHKKSF